MMRGTPPAEATRYLKEVTDFQRRHADLLWRGRFVDTESLVLQGAELIAKGYAAQNRLGVLVWNPTNQVATFSAEVAEFRLVTAAEPGRDRVEPFAPLASLASQTVRLLVWEKEN